MRALLAVSRADAALPAHRALEPDRATRLFERHRARLLAYCHRRLGSMHEAEDAVQTTFLYACRALGRGVVPTHELPWLLKIAANVCLSHWGESRRRVGEELVHDPGSLAGVEASDRREEVRAIREGLAALTDLQRRAILLREWRGLSYAEIQEELGVSRAAVETLLFRARRALAASLEAHVPTGSRGRTAGTSGRSARAPAPTGSRTPGGGRPARRSRREPPSVPV